MEVKITIKAMQGSEARRDDSRARLLSSQDQQEEQQEQQQQEQQQQQQEGGKGWFLGSREARRTMQRGGGQRRRQLEGYLGPTRWRKLQPNSMTFADSKYVNADDMITDHYQVREEGGVRKNSIATTTTLGRLHQTHSSEPEMKEPQLEIIYEIWCTVHWTC